MSAARLTTSLAREDGGMLVLVAALLPVLVFFLALAVEIGNWWVHKRHLQLQADAAALAGGALFTGCFGDAAGTNALIQSEATRFGGGPGSTYNAQVGGASAGPITLRYQSKTYAAGSVPADDTDERPPCESLEFDVKATETNPQLILPITGLPGVDAINAHARVELKKVKIFSGMLPLAVPEVRPRFVTATFVDEAGTVVGTPVSLTGPTPSAGLNTWSGTANVPVTAGKKIGVRIGLGQAYGICAAANGTGGDGYACFDAGDVDAGLVSIAGFGGAAGTPVAPVRSTFEVWPITACAGSPFFSEHSLPSGATACAAGVEVVLHTASGTVDPTKVKKFTATLNGPNGFKSTASLTHAAGIWSTGYAFSIPAGTGGYDVSLEWQYEGGAAQTLQDVQRIYSGDGNSGPVKTLALSGGSGGTTAYSLPDGAQTVTVNVGIEGNLQLTPVDKMVLLRLTDGSRTSAVACDGTGVSVFTASVVNGCGTPYQINEIGFCPDPTTPDPKTCIPLETGDFGNPTTKALDERFKACPPYQYPAHPEDDPRVVLLMITDLSALMGSGKTEVPVINFAAFYIAGWSGSTCATNALAPPGLDKTDRAIWGHFVFYAKPNPQNASDEICDPTAVTPCVPVLTR